MTRTEPVPFVDLVSMHRELRQELCQVFEGALGSAGFIGGPMVEEFEAAFARYCDTDYCVGVASGTDALRFALMAAGVKAGDMVVTVPHTFIATAEAISQAGGQPAFVDVDEKTYNLDPAKLKRYLELECLFDREEHKLLDRRTGRPVTAIVPVHLYGQMADMDPILELAAKYHLAVVEDACQAHGAQYFSNRENRWKKAGSMGRAAAFSFYPGKNLGACGEAGAVTTGDPQLARKIRMLRDHGQSRKHHHEIEGYNGRLDAIQAGILQVKLKYLPSSIERRIAAARRYRALFSDALFPDAARLLLPCEPLWTRSSYHLFVVRVADRDGLMAHLASLDISTGVHYPVPLHLQNAYKALGYREGDFPVTEKLAQEVLSLPMFPELTFEQQSQVVDGVLAFVEMHQPVEQPALALG